MMNRSIFYPSATSGHPSGMSRRPLSAAGSETIDHVFRQAMAADSADPFGLYVGTSTGQVFFSADEGDSWTVLIDCLPPIYSLSSALI